MGIYSAFQLLGRGLVEQLRRMQDLNVQSVRISHSFPNQLPFISPCFCEITEPRIGWDDTPHHPILLSSLQLFTPAWQASSLLVKAFL